MNGAESLVRTLVELGSRSLLLKSGHLGNAFRRRTRQGQRHAGGAGPVRGRGDRHGGRLWPHGRKAGGDLAASRTRSRQRPCQSPQRAPRRDADRQYRRQSRDLSCAVQLAALLGRRGLCATGVRLGPHFDQRPFRSGGRRPCGAGCAATPRTDRNIDLAGGYGMGGSRSSRPALAQAGCRGSRPPRQSLRQRRRSGLGREH